jgi:hypothetical protein
MTERPAGTLADGDPVDQRHCMFPDGAWTTHCSGPHWQLCSTEAPPSARRSPREHAHSSGAAGSTCGGNAATGLDIALKASTAAAAADTPESVNSRGRSFMFVLLG